MRRLLVLGACAPLIASCGLMPMQMSSAVVVTTAFAGASAAEIESQVTTPLERVLVELPGVRVVKSRSQDGLSVVEVHTRRQRGAADVELVSRAVEQVRRDLPAGVQLRRIAVERVPPP